MKQEDLSEADFNLLVGRCVKTLGNRVIEVRESEYLKERLNHILFRYADLLLEQEPPGSDLGAADRGRGVRLSFSLPLADRTATEVAEQAQRLGALVEGPVERPWNAREVVVADPDGYLLVFTEPLDVTKTLDEVLDNISEKGERDVPRV